MKLNELRPNAGSTRSTFRKGRGVGSGNGKTAGRGHKGQKARSGGGVRWGFEGGQTPLFRQVPKRGFNHRAFALRLLEIRLEQLNAFEDGETVNLETLKSKKLIKFPKCTDGFKVIGGGELTKKLTVEAHGFTRSAKEAIESAGGTAKEV
ncbi:MAG: 50S ribosomal protein L15 [Eubacteriales bacterium]|nr:50S ribosomal protein L15 [Eubacteriales bacterium]